MDEKIDILLVTLEKNGSVQDLERIRHRGCLLLHQPIDRWIRGFFGHMDHHVTTHDTSSNIEQHAACLFFFDLTDVLIVCLREHALESTYVDERNKQPITSYNRL